MKAKRAKLDDEQHAVRIDCPGCGFRHILPIRGHANSDQPTWEFNGDFERPTLTPSILARSGHYVDNSQSCWCTYERDHGEASPFSCGICHSFVRDGRIEFLNDCTHALAGQTVDLPEIAP